MEKSPNVPAGMRALLADLTEYDLRAVRPDLVATIETRARLLGRADRRRGGDESIYTESADGTPHTREVVIDAHGRLDTLMGVRPPATSVGETRDAPQPTGKGEIPAGSIDPRQQQLNRLMGVRD